MTDYQAYEAEIAALKAYADRKIEMLAERDAEITALKAQCGKLLVKLNIALARNTILSVENERLKGDAMEIYNDREHLKAENLTMRNYGVTAQAEIEALKAKLVVCHIDVTRIKAENDRLRAELPFDLAELSRLTTARAKAREAPPNPYACAGIAPAKAAECVVQDCTFVGNRPYREF